jgi:hypothetical protein
MRFELTLQSNLTSLHGPHRPHTALSSLSSLTPWPLARLSSGFLGDEKLCAAKVKCGERTVVEDLDDGGTDL